MADDERLREALIELEMLRQREAQMLEASQTLLAALEVYSAAATPAEALTSLFASLRTQLKAQAVALLHPEPDGKLRIAASDQTDWLCHTIESPIALERRTRTLMDLHMAGTWQGEVDVSGFSGLISTPLVVGDQCTILTVWKRPGASFHQSDSVFVQRLAGLAIRAYEAQMLAYERDRAQAELTGSLSATDDGYLILDQARTVTFANAAMDRVFASGGWTIGVRFEQAWEQYLNTAPDYVAPVVMPLRSLNIDAVAKTPSGQELSLPDGRTVLMRAAAFGTQQLVVSVADVTPLKTAQRMLAHRLAALEAAPDGLAIADTSGRLLYANAACATLWGFGDPVQTLGRKWLSCYDQQSGPKAPDFELTLTRRDGTTERTHDITGSALADGGQVLVVRDVTQRLAAEAREAGMERTLAHLQKQEAVSQLAAGIAHDFNNLLSAINGSATLIGMQPDLSVPVAEHTKRINAAGARAARLVNRLLDMNAQDSNKHQFAVEDALSDIEALVAPNLLPGQRFARTQSPNVNLSGDPGELNQSLINLILNGRDALGGGGGHITLTIHETTGTAEMTPQAGDLSPGRRYLQFDVADTGAGMTAAVIDQIFAPYFTTKGSMGTGLGLAMVALQIKAVGGAIAVTSDPGRGSTFSLFWPVADTAPAPQSSLFLKQSSDQSADLAGAMVIVLDDEPAVAGVIAQYLETLGAEVAQCTDPHDALDALADDPSAWSALVTDYDMPQLSGGDVAQQVQSFAPHLPIFLVTALARRLNDPRVSPDRIAGVFAKPVDLPQLAQAIAQSISGPDSGPPVNL